MINRVIASSATRYMLLGLMALSLISIVWSFYAMFSAQSQAASAAALRVAAERYVSFLKDVETSYRGYIITGNEDFLTPYQTVKTEIDRQASVFMDAATQAGLAPETPSRMIAVGKTLVDFADTVVAARTHSFNEAQTLIIARAGKSLMDSLREDLEVVEGWSWGRDGAVVNTSRFYVLITISLLTLVLVIGAFWYLASKARRTSLHARSLLADVIERAPVGLALLDRNLYINQANKAFAKMVTEKGVMRAGEALTSSAAQIEAQLHQRLQSAIVSRVRFKDTGADDTLDLLIDGKSRYIKADVFPVTLVSEAGTESPGAGIVLNDVTHQRESALELEMARDAAEAANRAKSTFLANMSHELRTPLTAVLGYCELIEEDLRDLGQEAILADLNKINVNARHLLVLINDVLDLSKIEAQKMEVHTVEFTVGTLLEELEATTGSLVAKNNNVLALTTDAPDTVMVTDDVKVKQILFNLIGNAAKFTTNGQISVHVVAIEEEGIPHTQFIIKDTGIGMSPEQLANLFQRFKQADETTTRKYGGTGLGLALTRALSNILGGRIEVESTEGEGATFTVTLPTRYEKRMALAEDGAEVAKDADQKDEAGAAMASKPPSVLVVDDDPSARELLTRRLEREGFTVTTAVNGAEALASILANRPLAVLLDVMMPGLDGWHVLRAIRENPAIRDIPVIMQTVLDERNFAYALGANSYLKKPIQRNALIEALSTFASNSAGHSVLIVDDDKDANEQLMAMLQRDGWDCRMALNGIEAMKALAEFKPDLVLVDLIIPEMDGYAFIREVRKNPEFDQLPVVVMTAEGVSSSKLHSLANETAGIVQKGSMPLADLVADLRRFAEQAKNN